MSGLWNIGKWQVGVIIGSPMGGRRQLAGVLSRREPYVYLDVALYATQRPNIIFQRA